MFLPKNMSLLVREVRSLRHENEKLSEGLLQQQKTPDDRQDSLWALVQDQQTTIAALKMDLDCRVDALQEENDRLIAKIALCQARLELSQLPFTDGQSAGTQRGRALSRTPEDSHPESPADK